MLCVQGQTMYQYVHTGCRLPIEICERVIDLIASTELVDRKDHSYSDNVYVQLGGHIILTTCALVCRAWNARSTYHLQKAVWLSSQAQVVSLSRRIRQNCHLQHAIDRAILRGDRSRSRYSQDIAYFNTFAAMF